jgi:hypothetical protein
LPRVGATLITDIEKSSEIRVSSDIANGENKSGPVISSDSPKPIGFIGKTIDLKAQQETNQDSKVERR